MIWEIIFAIYNIIYHNNIIIQFMILLYIIYKINIVIKELENKRLEIIYQAVTHDFNGTVVLRTSTSSTF